MRNILVYVEAAEGKAKNVGLEILTPAKVAAEGGEVIAAVIGKDVAEAAKQAIAVSYTHLRISLMKQTAILINCARGAVVDNEALAEALNSDKIAGAAIDVFDMEPPIPADYPLLKAKNTLLTPHVAFASKESMIRRAHIVFDNLYAYLEGKPVNVVDIK